MLRAAFTSRSWVAPQRHVHSRTPSGIPSRSGPAHRAHLRRGEPAVDHDQVAAVPPALVLHHAPQLPPARVADGAGQGVVAEHVPDLQVLDHDRLVLADEPSRQLVQMVTAAVGDPGVHLGGLPAGLLPVRRPLAACGRARRCASASRARSRRSWRRLVTFSPVDRVTSDVTPASTPTAASVAGPSWTVTAHSRDTCQRPAASRAAWSDGPGRKCAKGSGAPLRASSTEIFRPHMDDSV